MAKRVLKTLELTTLLVALDHLEEYGPSAAVPDPYEVPGECVYLAYLGDAHAAALAERLPYRNVKFSVPTTSGIVRKVYRKAAILHLMRFSFPNSEEFVPFVRGLDTVDRKYWIVMGANGKPIPRPRGKTKGKG
jgi:hypothetical protein